MIIFKLLKQGWLLFAHIVERVNSFVILFLIYFFIIGIYAIFTSSFRFLRKKGSYGWEPYPYQSKDLKDLEQEF